jgi:pilus assembly protein FimV
LALKTKIDLAMACNEIGDKEGARDLLAEVASSRHAELASRAKSLLQQLA